MLLNKEEIISAACSLTEQGTFAVLAVRTASGQIVLRPIGGRWGSGITDAVQEMAQNYPGCKMRLFESNSEHRHFIGIVPREQVLPYADYPPETKVAIEELRQKTCKSCR